jgi:hypothetical protein
VAIKSFERSREAILVAFDNVTQAYADECELSDMLALALRREVEHSGDTRPDPYKVLADYDQTRRHP